MRSHSQQTLSAVWGEGEASHLASGQPGTGALAALPFFGRGSLTDSSRVICTLAQGGWRRTENNPVAAVVAPNLTAKCQTGAGGGRRTDAGCLSVRLSAGEGGGFDAKNCNNATRASQKSHWGRTGAIRRSPRPSVWSKSGLMERHWQGERERKKRWSHASRVAFRIASVIGGIFPGHTASGK